MPPCSASSANQPKLTQAEDGIAEVKANSTKIGDCEIGKIENVPHIGDISLLTLEILTRSLSLLIVPSHFSLLSRSVSELERPLPTGALAAAAAFAAAPPALVMAISLETRPLVTRPGAGWRRVGGGGRLRDGGGEAVVEDAEDDFLARWE